MKISFIIPAMLVGASVAQAVVIDMTGNTTGAAGGEFADYSGLGDTGYATNWDDSVVNDGTVSLAVGDLALDNTDSPARLALGSFVGPNAEINFSPITDADDAATAFSVNGFIAIKLDSTAFNSDTFTLDSVSVSLWRAVAGSATTYQFAYDSTGNGYTTSDLLGTAVTNTTTGSGNTFTVSSALTSAAATQQEVRLYYWEMTNPFANTHLYEVSATYTVPEPSALGMLGLAGALLLIRRRRRS